MYSQKNLEYIFTWLVGLSNNIADPFYEGVLLGYGGALRDAEVITPEELLRLLRVKDAVKNESIKRAHALAKKTIKKIFEETK